MLMPPYIKCEAGNSDSPPFSAQKLCDVNSLSVHDRHAELLAIWQEIGEDKVSKLEQLRQIITAALDQIYDKAMEESVRKRMALEVSIAENEKRLKERLGNNALQAIASRELPLQTRLSMNTSQLHDLDSERVGCYGWVGGFLVMVELRKRVLSLRGALDLPPCNASADLDELLLSTMEALQKLYPGKVPSGFSFASLEGDQKPVFQRLQRFYKTLKAMEDTWVESFAQRAGTFVEEKREANVGHESKEHYLESCASSRTLKVVNPKNNKSQCHKRKPSEEASSLEQLSKKIFEKLDDISRRARHVLEMTGDDECQSIETSETSDSSESSQPSQGADYFRDLDLESKIYSKSPVTPTSVLPETTQNSVKPGTFVNACTSALLWPPKHLILGNSHPICFKDLPANFGSQGLVPENCLPSNSNEMQVEQAGPTFEIPNLKSGAQISKISNPMSETKQPLKTITNTIQANTNSNASSKRIFPPPPIMPTAPPPPPPPPPNVSKALRPKKSNTKLKRSSQIGNLYRILKGKLEGVGRTSEPSQGRRKLIGGSSTSTQGMAEALAEITRRSSYFRQIEEDAQRYKSPILEMKSAIESFETEKMDELLKFHQYVELHLEDLTDETQVLARFEGFPTKKLEVIRAAATLYSKLSAIANHLESWEVVSPLSRQLDKVTCYFDKIKMEVETLERIKDEESKLFKSHKITFDFNVLIRIKESMVDVSSSCIALALEESKKTKAAASRGHGDLMGPYDGNRLRRCLQMLWRAFQLSFRVYNFAGGQDDRAEELTCALAREMETYPQNSWFL
eukprot:Gb_27159 [translate_table: standard]